jgi:hypothetical protein
MAARTTLLKSFRRLSEDTKKVRLVVHTENKGIHQSLVDLYLNAVNAATDAPLRDVASGFVDQA